jgi:K+-sensing histidine kinase KdpD
LPKFFDLFAISAVSTPGGDLGLGPAVAARILALFGAAVSVENRDQPGIRFCVSLRSSASTADPDLAVTNAS